MMHKKTLLNLVMLVIFLSLASAIYFSEQESNRLELLTVIDTSSIHSIKINHNSNQTDIFKRDDGTWVIKNPVSIDANNFRINSLLDLLNTPVHNKYSVTEINLKSIGLQEPITSIQLNDTFIAFGESNPATGLRYIKIDNLIYTIEDVFFPLLSSNFSTLVSLNMLPADSKISKLTLQNQMITKDSNHFWQSNIATTADNINTIIDNWQHTQAFGVHKYFARNPDKTTADDEVLIYLQSQQQPIRYLITDTDPWLILARPEIDIEYHLELKAYDMLISPP
jgi:hypothetical protein